MKIGDVEDILNIFESPPEIQPIGSLSSSLQHPKRSNQPSPKLPTHSQVKCLRREKHFSSHLMFLQSVVLVEVEFLILLGSLEMILGLLDKLLNVSYQVSRSRHPTLIPNNSINR